MSAHRVPSTTGDLIEFMLRRLAEDHHAADTAMSRLIAEQVVNFPAEPVWWSTRSRGDDPIVAADPRRALDDVRARRRIVLHARAQIEHGSNIGVVNAYREMVRTLAATYQTHEDYRPEWAPSTSQN